MSNCVFCRFHSSYKDHLDQSKCMLCDNPWTPSLGPNREFTVEDLFLYQSLKILNGNLLTAYHGKIIYKIDKETVSQMFSNAVNQVIHGKPRTENRSYREVENHCQGLSREVRYCYIRPPEEERTLGIDWWQERFPVESSISTFRSPEKNFP